MGFKLLWKDIPKLTSCGHYEVSQDFSSLIDVLNRYINKYDLNLNPDFQRGHVWTKKQKVEFIEFLLKGGSTNNIIYFNHPGWMGSFEGEFVIVDGLQRLTSCIEFLENKFKVFDCYSTEIEFREHSDLIFNINNLKTKKEVLQWYLEINENSTPHTSEEINRVKELLSQLPPTKV